MHEHAIKNGLYDIDSPTEHPFYRNPLANRLLFIETRAPNDKRPLHSYVADAKEQGLTDEEIRTEKNPYVFTFKETLELIYSSETPKKYGRSVGFAVVSAKGDDYYLDIDFDINHDNEESNISFDISDVVYDTANMLGFTSRSGGMHIGLLLDQEIRNYEAHDDLDLGGESGGFRKAICPSPFHACNTKYSIESCPNQLVYWSDAFEREHINDVLYVDDDSTGDLFSKVDPNQYAETEMRQFDEPNDDDLYLSEKALLQIRADPELLADYGENAHELNSDLGMVLMANGRSVEQALDLFGKYPLRGKPDEFRRDLTRDHLSMLEGKVQSGSLHVPVKRLLSFGIDIFECESPAYADFTRNNSDSARMEHFVATNRYGDVEINEEPPAPTYFEFGKNRSITGTARSGKSYSLSSGLLYNYADLDDDEDAPKTVFLAPSHEEAQATLEKLNESVPKTEKLPPHDSVSWLIGRSKAARDFDMSTSGDYISGVTATHPEIAAKKHEGQGNVYDGYKQACLDSDIIVTVKEMLKDIDDIDLIVTAEEQVMQGMMAQPVKLIGAKPLGRIDRSLDHSFEREYQMGITQTLRQIDDLQKLDDTHKAIRTALGAADDIINLQDDWVENKAHTWSDVHANWNDLAEDIDQRLSELAVTEVNCEKIRNYIDFQGVDDLVISILEYEGIRLQGEPGFNDEGQPKRNNMQMFLIPRENTLVYDIGDVNVWAGGSIKHIVDDFQEAVNSKGEAPKVYSHLPPKPVQGGFDDFELHIYTGGKNPSEQTGHLRELPEQLQKVRGLNNLPSALAISGSSDHSADLSNGKIVRAYRPSPAARQEDLKQMTGAGTIACVPVTSRFCNGIDTGFFEYGIVDHAFYSQPMAEYQTEKHEDERYIEAAKMADCQNALLRVMNTPNEGTGKTPVIAPSRHLPDHLLEWLESFGITIKIHSEMSDLITDIAEVLSTDEDPLAVVAGNIVAQKPTETSGRLSMEEVVEIVNGSSAGNQGDQVSR